MRRIAEPRRVGSQGLLVGVGHDHPHTLGHEGLDDGEADPAGRASHGGCPSLELLHWRRWYRAPRAVPRPANDQWVGRMKRVDPSSRRSLGEDGAQHGARRD